MDIYCNRIVETYLKHVFILFSPRVLLSQNIDKRFSEKKKSLLIQIYALYDMIRVFK